MNMSHQQVKQQWRQQVQNIRHPTAYCQVCLGQKQYKDDPIITCGICESSIHKAHYSYEIVGKSVNKNHLTHNLDDWRCQRCRHLIDRKFSIAIKCELCPFSRGIMKKVMFETSPNHRKQIWVHPQCTAWGHPLVWIQNNKRTHYYKETPSTPTTKFWFRVEDQPSRKCVMCHETYGFKIKCTFYSCQKFYHVTCAKKIGVIRDLQSMRFEPNNDDYNPVYCPVYCEEHLEAYVLDFGNRVKLYTQKKDAEKFAHFTKVHNCYKIQLKNLTTSAKRAKQQQEIRNQFGKQLMIGGFEESSMSLSLSEPQSNQMNSSDSESHSSTFLAFLEQNYDLKDLDALLMKKRESIDEEKTVNIVRDSRHEKKTTKKEKKSKAHSNEQISEQVDRIIEEGNGQSMDIQESRQEKIIVIESHQIRLQRQNDRIREEKAIEEENYMENVQSERNESQAENHGLVQERNDNDNQQNQMVEQEQNQQKCENQKEEVVGQMVDESFRQDVDEIPQQNRNSQQPKSFRQLSEGELSQQLVPHSHAVTQKQHIQAVEAEEQENSPINQLRSVDRDDAQKMEQEHQELRQEPTQNPENQNQHYLTINRESGIQMNVHSQEKAEIISVKVENGARIKSEPNKEKDFPFPSSPQISDECYNPHG